MFGAGPLALLIIYQIVKRDPARHYWIIVLSTAELYGGYVFIKNKNNWGTEPRIEKPGCRDDDVGDGGVLMANADRLSFLFPMIAG